MNKFLYATQYYRYPTPLQNEWEKDIKNMGEYNLDTFQIRINWRANELREDEYNFDDIDALMELSVKNNKKVIIKFLLECAPQYIFDKYGAVRENIDGKKLMPAYHGAFFGGWQPCFTNKKVQERAAKFVKLVVERYKDYKNIILFNCWNEVRNRPVEECFCKHCRKEYGEYLKNKFSTIENLNKFYGASEDSFSTISMPSTPHGVWDMYEYLKFRGEYINSIKVKMVYDAIREIDKKDTYSNSCWF